MAKKGGLEYNQLATSFRNQNFQPVYFLYGEESFLIDELQDLLVEHALAPEHRDFNFDLVYGAEAEAKEVLALCAGYPIMAPRRVVIVRDVEKLADNRQLKEYAARPNPQAVVLFTSTTKPNLSAHPYRALKQHAAWSHFKPLYDNEVPGWINKRVEGLGFEIRPKAVQMLAEYVGSDLRTLAGEIDKLITYASPDTTLTPKHVLEAGGRTREHNVFELQKAIGKGDARRALHIADRMMQQASNETGEGLKIVAILSAYFQKLWRMPDHARRMSNSKLASVIGVSPYFVQEYVASAARFNKEDIAHAFSALMAADYELKGGSSRQPVLIITLLIQQLVAPGR